MFNDGPQRRVGEGALIYLPAGAAPLPVGLLKTLQTAAAAAAAAESAAKLLLVRLQDGCGHVALVFTVGSKASDRGPTLQTLRFAALASRLG